MVAGEMFVFILINISAYIGNNVCSMFMIRDQTIYENFVKCKLPDFINQTNHASLSLSLSLSCFSMC